MDGSAQQNKEARGARRVWFQQNIDFKVFDRSYQAWSTTLSETGIFLHTTLTFPLYTVLHLKFDLLGQPQTFSCEGVIVRQEVEGPIRGLGIMFQNLKGENVRILESFLEFYK
jgi:Tfp pilus assembly protein PilZ